MYAVSIKDGEGVVEKLIARGADVNAKNDNGQVSERHWDWGLRRMGAALLSPPFYPFLLHGKRGWGTKNGE